MEAKKKRRVNDPVKEYDRHMVRRTFGDDGTTLSCAVTVTDEGDRTWSFQSEGNRGIAVIRRSRDAAERDAFATMRRVEADGGAWLAMMPPGMMARLGVR